MQGGRGAVHRRAERRTEQQATRRTVKQSETPVNPLEWRNSLGYVGELSGIGAGPNPTASSLIRVEKRPSGRNGLLRLSTEKRRALARDRARLGREPGPIVEWTGHHHGEGGPANAEAAPLADGSESADPTTRGGQLPRPRLHSSLANAAQPAKPKFITYKVPLKVNVSQGQTLMAWSGSARF
jgi:hypothetical protein